MMLSVLRHFPRRDWANVSAALLIAHIAAHGLAESWDARRAPWSSNAPRANVAPSTPLRSTIDGGSTGEPDSADIAHPEARTIDANARGARHGAHESPAVEAATGVGCKDSLAASAR